jgi:hypothetical protein
VPMLLCQDQRNVVDRPKNDVSGSEFMSYQPWVEVAEEPKVNPTKSGECGGGVGLSIAFLSRESSAIFGV